MVVRCDFCDVATCKCDAVFANPSQSIKIRQMRRSYAQYAAKCSLRVITPLFKKKERHGNPGMLFKYNVSTNDSQLIHPFFFFLVNMAPSHIDVEKQKTSSNVIVVSLFIDFFHLFPLIFQFFFLDNFNQLIFSTSFNF